MLVLIHFGSATSAWNLSELDEQSNEKTLNDFEVDESSYPPESHVDSQSIQESPHDQQQHIPLSVSEQNKCKLLEKALHTSRQLNAN